MAFGLSSSGFSRKRLEDIKSELEAEFRSEFGDVNTAPDSVIGRIIGIIAKGQADTWEQLQAVYNSQYPDSADGFSLDNVAALVGVQRLAATRSTVTASASGAEGTALTTGRVVEVPDTGERFESTQSVTITKSNAVDIDVSVANVLDSTTYTITVNGTALDFTSDASATEAEIIAGLVSAVNGGSEPVSATDNGDNTMTIDADSVDTSFNASVDANLQIDQVASPMPMRSQNTGPIEALSGTLTEIVTPVSGWASVTNAEDADEGRNTETDEELRTRRAQSLQVAGSGTVESIRARLREVTNVEDAFVIENRTDSTDGSGRPSHSFEVVVAGGLDQDIADTLWEHKPAGIETYGTENINVTDSQGNTQVINFSRATEIYMHVKVTYTKYTEETFPSDGESQIEDNVLEYGQTHSIGEDVIVQRFFGPIFEVPGIATVTVEIATSATAGGSPGAYQTTNLAISQTETAVFDSSRITIVAA